MLTLAPTKPDTHRSPVASAPAGHHARRVLAVRALAAQLDWLANGTPCWANGRVIWRLGDGTDFHPRSSDLARAQQIVYKIRQYPLASRTVFGDAAAWQVEILQRLELAGRLRQIKVDSAAQQDTQRMIALLPAEALCVYGDVPGPPSLALVALAASGRATVAVTEQVTALAQDSTLPAPVRTLAALTLGAMERERYLARATLRAHPFSRDTVLRPAFERGLREGLPLRPPLFASLFALGGKPLARRGERLWADIPSPFPLPFSLLHETVLRGGTDTATRVERLLSAAELIQGRGATVAHRLLTVRHEMTSSGLDPGDRRHKTHGRCKVEAARLRLSRAEASGEVADRFDQILRRGADGDNQLSLIANILQFAEDLLTISPASNYVLRTLRDALDQCLRLPSPLRTAFMALASEQSAIIWDATNLAKRVQANPNGIDFGISLQNRWLQEGAKLGKVLRVTGDAQLVREAIRLGIYDTAALHLCHDQGYADHLRLLIRLVRQFHPHPAESAEKAFFDFSQAIRTTLCVFPSGDEARDALQPLERAFAAAVRRCEPKRVLLRVFTALLSAAPRGRAERALAVTRVGVTVDPYLNWAKTASDEAWSEYGPPLAAAAVLLAKRTPDRLGPYFAALVAAVPTEATSFQINPLGVELTAALAQGDTDRFAAFLTLGITHTKDDDEFTYQDWLRQGIALLFRFPEIAVPVAALFPVQPRRCLALLRQMGRATHMGSDVLDPLDDCRFEGGGTAASDDAEWQALCAVAPDAAPLVAQLWRAQWLLGRAAEVPPGVRAVLEERNRRASELAYIEALCATDTTVVAPGLIKRRDNLRARLQTEGCRTDVSGEVQDRLRNAVTEAQMAAAEQQAALCFRERLRQAVGSLPQGLTMTHDLENATVLAVTITQNRKALLKLLRATVSGEANPFEDHPENVAFRERLTASAVSIAEWRTGAREQVSLPDHGLTLTMFLETDPLHVLQMGGYFGTCLSAGSGCNAFSTVANALEQNKRVLFVRDASGRVIARKLIGISEEGAMVGFHTYCSLQDEAAAAVRTTVRDYLSR
ncbi:MAG: hypothetical protein V4671_28345, partial [Armatimonadota bacterium]